MLAVQLDLFKTPEECEMDALRRSIEDVRKSSEKVRKGTYARLNELVKDCVDLRFRLEVMERNICKG